MFLTCACTCPLTTMFILLYLRRKCSFRSSKRSIDSSSCRGSSSLLVGGRDLDERSAQLVRVSLQLLDDGKNGGVQAEGVKGGLLGYKGVERGDNIWAKGVVDVVEDGGCVGVIGLGLGLGFSVGVGDVGLRDNEASQHVVQSNGKVSELESYLQSGCVARDAQGTEERAIPVSDVRGQDIGLGVDGLEVVQDSGNIPLFNLGGGDGRDGGGEDEGSDQVEHFE